MAIEDFGQLDFFGRTEGDPADPGASQSLDADVIARRLRTLLLTSPIHALHRNKQLRPETRHADVRSLALMALDLAIEGMGLEEGITRRDLIGRLGQLAPEFAGEAPGPQFTAVCEYVVDGLLNAPRSEAFREEYLALEAAGPLLREFEYRLLQEEERDGRVVLRATKYAINLCLRMLEVEIEDAQVANEAMLEDQLRRGAIDRAVQSAHQTRLLSMGLEEKIESLLHRLRRDAQQVDFVADLKPQLDEARAHLGRRSESSERLLDVVEERLDEARGEAARELARLRETLRDCRARNGRLVERVMSATRQFLDEQERQAFRRARNGRLPAMESEVMKEAVRLPSVRINEMAPSIVALLHPPAPPLVLSFSGLIDSCFAPKRQVHTMEALFDDSPLVALDTQRGRWSPEDHQLIREWLEQTVEAAGAQEMRLSSLIARAVGEGRPASWIHLLALEVLRVMETHDRAEEAGPTLHVEPADQTFSADGVTGDDLRLCTGGIGA